MVGGTWQTGHLDTLIIPEYRQRQVINKDLIRELAFSIMKHGLLHPLVVRYNEEGNRTLVAGYRRYLALCHLRDGGESYPFNDQHVEIGDYPFVLLTEMDEISAREAELEENIRRVDLTWQEKTQAIADLHAFRASQNPGQTKQETAKEAEISPAAVTRATVVAPFLHQPSVKEAVSERAAYNIVLRQSEDVFLTELNKFTRVPHRLYVGDFREVMDRLPPADCICCDPPYGMDAAEFGDAASVSHQYDDNPERVARLLQDFAALSHRLAKPKSHLYLFCQPQWFWRIGEWLALSEARWWIWQTPLIWYKGSSGHSPHPDHGPRRSYEFILYAIRGEKHINQTFLDVKTFAAPDSKRHAAEKPVQLYADLLRNSVRPGDIVLDPFCGSGTIFPAANLTNTTAYGVELDPEMAKIAEARFRESTIEADTEALANL